MKNTNSCRKFGNYSSPRCRVVNVASEHPLLSGSYGKEGYPGDYDNGDDNKYDYNF